MFRCAWLAVLLFCSISFAQDKARLDVSELSNVTASNPCNVADWWGGPLLETLRKNLQVSLNQHANIDVVEAERLRAYRPSFDSQVTTVHKNRLVKNSQFSVRGFVQKFDLCQFTDTSQTRLQAAVAIRINILDVRDGAMVDSFVAESNSEEVVQGDRTDLRGSALGSGVFKDSVVGKAMMLALADATSGIVKRLPASAMATPADYKVKTFRAPGRR